MTLVQYINVYLDVFCILVDLIIMMVMLTSEYRKEKLNKIFVYILTGNLLMLVCDLIICLSGDKVGAGTHLILIVAHVLIFCSGPIVTIGVAYYVAVFFQQKGMLSKGLSIATYAAIVPCVIDILFCLINLFNGMYYTLDVSNNAFRRNDLFLLNQVFSFISIAIITGIIIACQKKLEKREMVFCSLIQSFRQSHY